MNKVFVLGVIALLLLAAVLRTPIVPAETSYSIVVEKSGLLFTNDFSGNKTYPKIVLTDNGNYELYAYETSGFLKLYMNMLVTTSNWARCDVYVTTRQGVIEVRFKNITSTGSGSAGQAKIVIYDQPLSETLNDTLWADDIYHLQVRISLYNDTHYELGIDIGKESSYSTIATYYVQKGIKTIRISESEIAILEDYLVASISGDDNCTYLYLSVHGKKIIAYYDYVKVFEENKTIVVEGLEANYTVEIVDEYGSTISETSEGSSVNITLNDFYVKNVTVKIYDSEGKLLAWKSFSELYGGTVLKLAKPGEDETETGEDETEKSFWDRIKDFLSDIWGRIKFWEHTGATSNLTLYIANNPGADYKIYVFVPRSFMPDKCITKEVSSLNSTVEVRFENLPANVTVKVKVVSGGYWVEEEVKLENPENSITIDYSNIAKELGFWDKVKLWIYEHLFRW